MNRLFIIVMGILLGLTGISKATEYSFGDWAIDTGLPGDATVVYAIDAGITNLDGLSAFADLVDVHLQGNLLTGIDADDFAGITNLNLIFLQHNQISSIEVNSFADLVNLEILHLGDNALTSIADGTFNGLTNLGMLRLSTNQITSIDANGFNGLINLETLLLLSNQLTSIAAGTFEGLDNLQYLDLSYNPIDDLNLSGCTFNALNDLLLYDLNIIKVDLSGSTLSELSFETIIDSLSSVPTIDELTLASADLATVHMPFQLQQMTSVSSLNISDIIWSADVINDNYGVIVHIVDNLDLGGSLDELTIDDILYQARKIYFNNFDAIEDNTLLGVLIDPECSFGDWAIYTGLDPHASSADAIDAGITNLDGLSVFVDLEVLRLGDNLITSIDADDFAGLTNLSHLSLDSNQINNIEDNSFTDLINLHRLFLNDNALTSITADTFNGLTNLLYLRLFVNQISSVDANSFNGLINIENLRVDDNQLTSIASGTFVGLDNLRLLGLSKNPITDLNLSGCTFNVLDTFVIPNIGMLKVDLSGSTLSEISFETIFDSLSNVPTITDLTLANADLSLVPVPYQLANVASVSSLNISDITWSMDVLNENYGVIVYIVNKLDNGGSLDELTIDEILYQARKIDFNNFDAIEDNTLLGVLIDPECSFGDWAVFTGLDPAVSSVDAIDAGITNLDGLSDFTNLTDLRLHGNPLTAIKADDFAGLTNLHYLFLNHNQISSIAPDSFIDLTNLQMLFLGDNALESITAGSFNGLTDLRELKLLLNQITSIAPDSFNGLINLEGLSLNDNQLTAIAPGTFVGLDNLVSLDLANNSMADLNLSGCTFNSLYELYLDNTAIARVDLSDSILNINSFNTICSSLGNVPTVTELTLANADLSAVNSPGALMQIGSLTSLNISDIIWNINVIDNSYDPVIYIINNMDQNGLAELTIDGDIYLVRKGDFDNWDAIEGNTLIITDCVYDLPGDVNDDCICNLEDFAIMAASWLIDCNSTPSDPACVLKN